MIKLKSEIMAILDGFLDYSQEQKPRHDYAPFFDDIKETVTEYFARDRGSYRQKLHELELALYSEISLRYTEYDPPFDKGLFNPPAEYYDLGKLFYEFPLTDTTNAEFFDAWVYDWEDIDKPETTEDRDKIYWRRVEIERDDEGEIIYKDVWDSWENPKELETPPEHVWQKQIIVKNTLLDEWIDDIETNATNEKELGRIENLSMFLSNSMCNSGSYLLWEDTPDTKYYPRKKEIANKLFIEKNYKKCVQALNLPVRIPSYLL